jgi:glycosyltransferase involved in cell wall biosynthesis
MKILVNASITRVGGGVQKSVEFIRASASQRSSHQFFYVLSEAVARNLDRVVEIDPSHTMVTPASPSRPMLGRETRRVIREIERRFEPDVIYTVFGPAYIRFRSPHLMGFAVPWVTHPNRHAWQTLRNPIGRARFWAWCRYISFWTRFADRWVLETSVAADGLARVLARSRDRFHVVPNVPGGVYDSASAEADGPLPGTEKADAKDVNVLVFSHWYPHKNLEIVPSVAADLRTRDGSRRYRFFLTFDTSLKAWADIRRRARDLRVEDRVVNLGPILVGDGPRLYRSSDVVFLPTVLETFTATYPEAMACRKPIVTTDLPFARDICGEAALYASPNDPAGAAERIVRLAGDDRLREELVRKGLERLAQSKTRQQVYEMVLDLLEQTARTRQGVPSSD